MFGFAMRTRQARVDELLPKIHEAMTSMNGVEKASVLILANAQLGLAGEMYGAEFSSSPQSNPGLAAGIVDQMLEIYRAGEVVAEQTSVNLARYLRVHSVSVLVVMATVASGMNAKKYKSAAAMAWKEIWTARTHAENALLWLRKAEAAAGAPCFPPVRKRRMSDIEALACASKLPGFLSRRRKPAAS